MTYYVKASETCKILNLHKNCFLIIFDFLNDGENTTDQISLIQVLRTKKKWIDDLCLCYEKQTFKNVSTIVYRCKGFQLLSKYPHYVQFTKNFRQMIQWKAEDAKCMRKIYLTKEQTLEFKQENLDGSNSTFQFKTIVDPHNPPDNLWEQTCKDIYTDQDGNWLSMLLEYDNTTFYLTLCLPRLEMLYTKNCCNIATKHYIIPYGYAWICQSKKSNWIRFYTPTSADNTKFCSNFLYNIPYVITDENKFKIYCELVNTVTKKKIEK